MLLCQWERRGGSAVAPIAIATDGSAAHGTAPAVAGSLGGGRGSNGSLVLRSVGAPPPLR